MEVDFEKIKQQYEKEIKDVLALDMPKNQRANLRELSTAARVMWATLHLLTREQAFELRDMINGAKKRIKK